MSTSPPSATRGDLPAEVRRAGFRSLERVCVFTDGARTLAEVTGVLHRYPRTVRVSLATATRLAAAGAPLCAPAPVAGARR